MTYTQDDHGSMQVRMEQGIDGLNNLADIEEGYVLDARNVDLSSPGFIQKRAGYHLYGCKLPIRVKEYTLVNGGADDYTSVTMQFDFVPKYERTIQLWLNNNASNSAYGDARFYQVDDRTETVFARIKDYTTNPNINTVTTETVLEIQHSGSVYYVTPIAVFDNNTFILPLQPLLAAGISPNLGAGAATEKVTRFGVGPTFNCLVKEHIASIAAEDSTTILVTVNDITELDIQTYALVRFDAGITNSSAVGGVTGYVSSIIGNEVRVTLYAAYAGAAANNFPRIFYTNGYTHYFKSQTAEFLSYSLPSIAAKTILSCNSMYSVTYNKIIVSTTSATYTDVGFLYGTGIDVPAVNLLAYFYDTDLVQNRMVTGYSGNVFVEQYPPDRVYNTRKTTVLAGQTLTLNASGVGNVTIPTPRPYILGDTVYLEQAADTSWELTTYEFVVTRINSEASLQLTNTDYASTSITVKTGAKLRFSRLTTMVQFITETFDEIPLVFPGCTFQTLVGTAYATHKAKTVNYYGTAAEMPLGVYTNIIVLENATLYESDSTITFGAVFTPVNYPDSAALDNYEPILSSYFPDSTVDLSHALIDRNIYIAGQKDGLWKFNGSEIVNQYFPSPPSVLATNVPSSTGNLAIVEDSDGRKVGNFYSIVLTYSYFEFVNGILTEIESGITSPNTTVIQAAPATDGSFNSQLIEVQVKTIPRGVGLPADNIFINAYRTLDGTSDGILDGQIFYREVSKVNNPDTPYINLYVGTLTSTLLEDNGKVLYASVSQNAEDELTRNIRTPPRANNIVNFQNRLVAFNGRENPYFNFSGIRVFDPDSLTSAFGANGLLTFVPATSELVEYQFCLCPVDDTTTTTTVVSPSTATEIEYQVFTTETFDVTEATYADTSNRLNVASDLLLPAYLGTGDTFLLKAVARDNYRTEYDGFNFDSQIFTTISTSGAVIALTAAQKKWTAPVVASLDNRYGVFYFGEKDTSSNVISLSITNTYIELELSASPRLAGFYDGYWLVLRGDDAFAYYPQMRDKNDADNRQYNLNEEVVFKATLVSGSTYTLAPYKIIGFSTVADYMLLQAMDYSIDIEISATTNVGDLQIFFAPNVGITNHVLYAAVGSISNPSNTLVLETSAVADLGLTADVDYVTIDGIPNDSATSRLPNEKGIQVNGTHLVAAYDAGTSVSEVTVYIDPPLDIFPDFTAAVVAGTMVTPSLVTFASTYMEVNYPSHAQSIALPLQENQWVYVIAKTSDSLQHSLQVSGWYQIYQIKTVSGWSNQIGLGSLYGLRLYMDGDAIDKASLVGMTNLKILACRIDGGSFSSTVQYVPVPVPVTPTADVTGTMFGPLDGQTPYERVIKRLGTAISTALATDGFAYWGANPGNLLREFPINGFKFINHKWPNNKYANARDSDIGFFDANKYSLEMDLAAGYYEWDADSGKVTSTGAIQTDDYLEESYPSRMWWTPIGDTSFRDVSFYDLTNEDGEEIIGAIPFEEYILVFKESQIFKVKIETTGPILDPVQAKVGAVSKKCIVPTDKGCMFLAKSGFFFTDGNECHKIIRLNRVFKDYIKNNNSLFPFMAGGYDPTNYLIRLGAPIADSIDGSYLSQDRNLQLNFNNKDISGIVTGGGWTVNTNMSANMWLHFNEASYFGSHTGEIFRIRSEFAATRYRDDESAIESYIDTRFYDFGAADSYKDVRETVIQLDTKYDNSMTIASAWNFRQSYETIGSFNLDVSALASDEIGDRYTASQKYIESRRQTVIPSRSIQLSFRLSNTTIDQGAGVHGFWVHVNKIGPKMIRQR